MGCQTVLRYLENLPEGVRVGGALLVAGFVRPIANLETAEEEEVAASWTDEPIDLGKVHAHLSKCIALFSNDDPWVTLDNADIFKEQLGAEIIIESKHRHFDEAQEPAILAAALKLVA